MLVPGPTDGDHQHWAGEHDGPGPQDRALGHGQVPGGSCVRPPPGRGHLDQGPLPRHPPVAGAHGHHHGLPSPHQQQGDAPQHGGVPQRALPIHGQTGVL